MHTREYWQHSLCTEKQQSNCWDICTGPPHFQKFSALLEQPPGIFTHCRNCPSFRVWKVTQIPFRYMQAEMTFLVHLTGQRIPTSSSVPGAIAQTHMSSLASWENTQWHTATPHKHFLPQSPVTRDTHECESQRSQQGGKCSLRSSGSQPEFLHNSFHHCHLPQSNKCHLGIPHLHPWALT